MGKVSTNVDREQQQLLAAIKDDAEKAPIFSKNDAEFKKIADSISCKAVMRTLNLSSDVPLQLATTCGTMAELVDKIPAL